MIRNVSIRRAPARFSLSDECQRILVSPQLDDTILKIPGPSGKRLILPFSDLGAGGREFESPHPDHARWCYVRCEVSRCRPARLPSLRPGGGADVAVPTCGG